MAINPLQIPSYAAPQQVDFRSLAELPQVYQKAQAEQVRRQTLADLGQGGQIDPMKLIASGDMNLANLGMQQIAKQEQAKRDERDFAFRQQESQRAQGNADRSHGLQASQIAFQREQAKEKPTIQKVKDAAGNESLLQVFPDGRSKPISVAEASAIAGGGPNNPFAPDGKQTEGQANAGLYAGRMFQAEKVLREAEVEAAAQSPLERGAAALPGAGTVFNLNSNAYQKFDQAQRNFINAVLRRESGAVINPDEFDNARKQYFPAPGDTKDRLAQKRANRQEAIRGIAGAAGPAWKAPATFEADGSMVDRGAKPASRDLGPSGNAILDKAKAAISQGADPEKVKQRLIQNGIDPSGL